MKSYTDIEQSNILAEILPIESADMFYRDNGIDVKLMWEHNAPKVESPCWSLAALLNVLPYPSLHKTFIGWRCDSYDKEGKICKLGEEADNQIDACYEMIINLLK